MTCFDFGIINKYNLFAFGDVTQSDSDVEGRVAVGGSLVLKNISIGDRLTTSYGVDDTLVVGGNLVWTNGTNKAGNTIMRSVGSYSFSNVSHEKADSNQPKRPSIFPIDFVESLKKLTDASTDWSNTLSLGSVFVANCYGTIFLVGNSPTLNVFKFDTNQIAKTSNILGGAGNTLSTINGISIVVPENSTVLINVSGTNVIFGNYQIFRSTNVPSVFPANVSSFCGTIQPGQVPTANQKTKILWNFYQATSIQMGTTSIQGSLLAPLTTLKTGGANIEGNVMVNNVDNSRGNTEFHYYPFSGCLPLVDSQPKLSTIKYASNKKITPGETFDYTIVVTNKTNTQITNLKLEDTLDLNTEYIMESAKALINTSIASFIDSSSINKVILTLNDNIAPFSTSIFTFKVRVKTNTSIDTQIKNIRLLTSKEITIPIKTNETIVSVQYANLKITKVADKESVECNGNLSYEFTIENIGNIDATNVVFKDSFEDEFEFDILSIVAPLGSSITKDSQYNSVSITLQKIPAKTKISIIIPGIIKCCTNK